MIVQYDADFIKAFKKLDVRIRKSFKQRIIKFAKNPLNPLNPQLNNHLLKREYEGHRSINISADYRAIYIEINENEEPIAYFVAIGTHAQLYREKKVNN